ncbi:MAG: endonuclease V [Theionarchaea archaeon]|nr:endonuclease V [Theionarchaea archaeon]
MLSKHVMEVDCFESQDIETLAGVDVTYKGNTASASCVVMDTDFSLIDQITMKCTPRFPYMSSFFAFREFPLIYEVIKKARFDLLFVHGHGRAHPRRFGLACHTGMYFGKPTVGVAGQLLTGTYDTGFETYTHVFDGPEIIGAVLKTHPTMNPVIVSIGNMISLESAIQYTFSAVKDHKFPEVLRRAHQVSKKALDRE